MRFLHAPEPGSSSRERRGSSATAQRSAPLPTGPVTFCFSDIEGSTRLAHALGTEFVDVLVDHDRLLREAFSAHEGITVNTEGDAFFVVFPTASAGIAGALAAQEALAAHRWPPEVELRVRMGRHTGEAALSADHGYVGVAVHQAARIVAAAHGGQILASKATVSLATTMPAGASFVDLGDYRLKDFDKPQRLFGLRHRSLAADLPAPRVPPAVASLPKAVDSFVGRDAESIELVGLLAAFVGGR